MHYLGPRVEDKMSKQVIFAGRNGVIFVHHPDNEEPLDGKWGHGPVEQCRVRYSLPKRDANVSNARVRSAPNRVPREEPRVKEQDDATGVLKPVR
jgi:PapC C-terminal domain